jgi:hypothetical protein
VGQAEHAPILDYIRARTPPTYRILILGNAAMQALRVPAVMTRDFDASMHGPTGEQPSWDDLLEIARSIDPDCEPANDHATILLRIPTPSGVAEIDLIRGRSRPGRFLTKDFLELVAFLAEPLDDKTLLPRAEALAVMKAWAAHDQHSRGRRGRRDQYLRDLDALRDAVVAQGDSFEQRMLARLLERVRPARSRAGASASLSEHGFLLP